ncbi:hypothetical protein HDE_10940 [Halotydeus destructor]|nr:hypothetical protein HDE_10940 [Halotydeus destructor]
MIYLMSTKGVNVYFGPPSQLVGYLVQQGIKCPKTRSLGEIAIKACFEDIPDATTYMSSCPNDDKSWKRLEDMKQKSSGSFSYETKQLWLRSFQGRAVKTPLLISSICVTAALWVIASRMTKYPIGEEDGCQMSEVNDTLTSKQLRDLVVEKNTRIRNVASIIYAVFLIMVDIYTSSTATLFGAEVSTLGREIQNGWYRVSAVFVSVIIHGVIEVTITSALSVSLFVSFSHMLDLETWRLVSFFTFTALVSFIFWLGGLCLGCLLRDKFYYLLLASSCLEIPLTMVSSFIVQPDRASALLRPYFKVNFFDHAYRGTLSVLYGFGRCDAKLARQRSLLGDFSMSQSPYKIIGDSIGSVSVSNDTLFTYSKLLNIDYAILYDISHEVEKQFNQFVGQDLDKTEPSYMLQRYDIANDGQDIFYNYLCLVLALLGGLVIAFASLKRAIR